MAIGFLIIIIFPFVFYYTQINNLNQKINTIKKAMKEEKETYIDSLTGKTHWTGNGEQVIRTTVNKLGKIPEGCIGGDRILQGVNSGKVYRNYSYENYVKYVQSQIDEGKCWCLERSAFTNSNSDLKYNIIEKYFYTLDKKKEYEFYDITCPSGRIVHEAKAFYIYYLNKVITLKPHKIEIIEINEEEYKKLGGK